MESLRKLVKRRGTEIDELLVSGISQLTPVSRLKLCTLSYPEFVFPCGSNLPRKSTHESSSNAVSSFCCIEKLMTAPGAGGRGIMSISRAYADTCTLTILAIGQTSPIVVSALTASCSRSLMALAADRDVSSVYAGR